MTIYLFRLTWQKVRALQIFAEKVYIPHSSVKGMVIIIRRLELVSVYIYVKLGAPVSRLLFSVEVEEALRFSKTRNSGWSETGFEQHVQYSQSDKEK